MIILARHFDPQTLGLKVKTKSLTVSGEAFCFLH